MSRAAYRKARRLQTRHARRGHAPWCFCPEVRQAMSLAIKRRQRRDPLHLTRVRVDTWLFLHGEDPDAEDA